MRPLIPGHFFRRSGTAGQHAEKTRFRYGFRRYGRLDAADRKAVYIGDSEVDILTAENAGIDGIICLWGFREESFLRERGARVTVSRAEEIAALV